MSKPLIRLGDKTTHGGVVIEASQKTDIGSIPVSRVGDKVTCPRCSPGIFPIVTGDSTLIIDDRAVARDGDSIACGAVLIASQQTTIDFV